MSGEDVSEGPFRIDNQNYPPRDFSLLAPRDGSIRSVLDFELAWENNGDPNPEDCLTYSVYISTAPDFSGTAPVTGITTPSYQVPPGMLLEETTYFWKVAARDPLGLATFCREPFAAFTLNRSKAESEDGRLYAEITSGLPANGYLKVEIIPTAGTPALKAAEEDTVADRHLKTLGENSYRLSVCTINDQPLPAEHPRILVRLDYPDTDGDNYYDGTLVQASSLRYAFLDENNRRWEPLSAVSPSRAGSKQVRVTLDRLGIITLLGVIVPLTPVSCVVNYPNPFCAGKEETRIRYVLTGATDVRVRIYTLLGDLVLERMYHAGEEGAKGQPAGYTNEIRWDGRNDAGTLVANGMYLMEIRAGSERLTRRIGVVK
jgi:hypothetical protein